MLVLKTTEHTHIYLIPLHLPIEAMVAVAIWVMIQVFLVILLGFPELTRWCDLRDDG